MCGLTGFLSPVPLSVDTATATLGTMSACLLHRGPDDAGAWVDADAGIALGHRRLSILDLSAAGHQPMVSASGRYVMVLNGEIYNHLELRGQLAGAHAVWRGHSDTETVMAGFDHWGIELTLQKAVGMFAFAVWDRRDRVLTLARDRMGEKPLYYGFQGETFLFGSELKALRSHTDFQNKLDRNVLALFLRHGYVPAPYSIYQGIQKLLPGTFIQLSVRHNANVLPSPVAYWSLCNVVESGASEPFRGTLEQAVDELETRLMQAVALQRVADVPLGAFLSGGIDSSTVVALMQAQSSDPVKTFTIGFHEEGYNEAQHAKAVAAHLGTDHTELYVTWCEALDVIPRLPGIYDEPFGDASGVPTFLVAQLARQHVTVSLSGDGGDELFFGYGRYPHARRLAGLNRIPRPMRRASAAVVDAVRAIALDPASARSPAAMRTPQLIQKARRLAELLRAGTTPLVYRCLISHWNDPVSLVIGSREPDTVFTGGSYPGGIDVERTLMYIDSISILPEDILTKVDRAAMSVGLETRVPMLDHRVVEFAQSLPLSHVYDPAGFGGAKIVLKKLLGRYIPASMIERPKQGFGVPIGVWLRGPLRDWAEALLDPGYVRHQGIFDVRILSRKWREYLAGSANWESQLWDVLMFQAWAQSARL
jgi:asparagine synthase (glutamine-hydrolysing)